MVSSVGFLDFSRLLGWLALHSLWQLTIVWFVVWGIVSCVPNRYLRLRYAMMVVGLVSMGIQPAVSLFWMTELTPSAALHPPSDLTSVNVVSSSQVSPISNPFLPEAHQREQLLSANVSIRTELKPTNVSEGHETLRDQTGPTQRWMKRFVLPILGAIWVMGVALAFLRISLGLSLICKMKRNVLAASADIHAILRLLQSKSPCLFSVCIYESEWVRVPTLVGMFRPMILLPIGLATGLSPVELEMIIAHELAHVRRYDLWVNTVQLVLETVFFFHPCVWHLSRSIRVQRELCCDALAAQSKESRLALGRALLKLEIGRRRSEFLSVAATDGELLARIRALTEKTDSQRSGWLNIPIALLTLSLIFLMCVWVQANTSHKQPSQTKSATSEKTTDVAPMQDDESEPVKDTSLADHSAADAVQLNKVASDGVCTVKGQIVDEAGNPIPNARAILQIDATPFQELPASVDENGEFEFVVNKTAGTIKPKRPREFYLWASAPGYNLKCVCPQSDPTQLDETHIKHLTVKLRPAESVRAQILKQGSPCVGMFVEPYYFAVPNGSYEADTGTGLTGLSSPAPAELREMHRTASDKDGFVKLRGISQKLLHSVRVWEDGMIPQIFPSSYRPVTNVSLQPTANLVIRVTTSDDVLHATNLEGRSIYVVSENKTPFEELSRCVVRGALDRNGEFRVDGLMAGTVSVNLLTSSNDSLQPIPQKPSILGPAESKEIKIQLAEAIRVKGQVLIRGTQEPVPNHSLYIDEPTGGRNGYHASVCSQEDGSFSIWAHPGSYTIHSVRWQGSQDKWYNSSSLHINVPSSNDIFELEPLLVHPIQMISGKLLDAEAQPLANRNFFLAEKKHLSLPRDTISICAGRTKADGTFLIGIDEGKSIENPSFEWRLLASGDEVHGIGNHTPLRVESSSPLTLIDAR